MIKMVGVDIESIKSFKKLCVDKNFIKMLFSNKEINYCMQKKNPYPSLAGKFCAKEAVIKVCSEKLTPKDIQIIKNKNGKLDVYIKGKFLDNIKCSISHSDEYAVAFAVLET